MVPEDVGLCRCFVAPKALAPYLDGQTGPEHAVETDWLRIRVRRRHLEQATLCGDGEGIEPSCSNVEHRFPHPKRKLFKRARRLRSNQPFPKRKALWEAASEEAETAVTKFFALSLNLRLAAELLSLEPEDDPNMELSLVFSRVHSGSNAFSDPKASA